MTDAGGGREDPEVPDRGTLLIHQSREFGIPVETTQQDLGESRLRHASF